MWKRGAARNQSTAFRNGSINSTWFLNEHTLAHRSPGKLAIVWNTERQRTRYANFVVSVKMMGGNWNDWQCNRMQKPKWCKMDIASHRIDVYYFNFAHLDTSNQELLQKPPHAMVTFNVEYWLLVLLSRCFLLSVSLVTEITYWPLLKWLKSFLFLNFFYFWNKS